MKVFIYSIPRTNAQGIHDWSSDVSGQKLLKTKVGKAKDRIQALPNQKVGGIANGLSNKPWLENGVQVKDEQGNPLTLQDKMEKKWGLPKGYLHNRPSDPNVPYKERVYSYYDKKVWALNDGCTVLDLTKMDDELGYYVFLDSKYVANSEKEWKEHKWPKAMYYIALENESEELKYNRNQIKSKAFSALHSESMIPTIKFKIVVLLDLAKATTSLTEEQVHNLLYEYIDKSTFTPNSNIDKFNALYNLLADNKGREELEARFILKQGIDSRVIYEKQGAYNWLNGAAGLLVLGENLTEAVDFILNPKKSSLVDDLKQAIKFKMM